MIINFESLYRHQRSRRYFSCQSGVSKKSVKKFLPVTDAAKSEYTGKCTGKQHRIQGFCPLHPVPFIVRFAAYYLYVILLTVRCVTYCAFCCFLYAQTYLLCIIAIRPYSFELLHDQLLQPCLYPQLHLFQLS